MDQNAQIRAGATGNALGPGSPDEVARLGRENIDAGTQELVRRRGQVGPISDQADTGTVARALFDNEYDAAKARTDAAYEVPELKNPVTVTLKPSFVKDFKGKLRDFYSNAGGKMPFALKEIVDDMFGEMSDDFKINSAAVANVDRRLTDFASETKLSGKRKQAAFASSLGDLLQRHVADQLPAEVKAALAKAKATRLEQGQRFEQGAMGRAFKEKQYGEPAVPDVELPGALVKPGAKGGSAIQGLVKAIGPKASETTLREQIRRLVDAGKFKTVDDFDGYDEALKDFPGVKKDIQALQNQAAMNDLFARTPLGKAANPDVPIIQHVSDMLKKPGGQEFQYFANQVRTSGDPKALAGLRRAMAEHVKAAGGAKRLDAGGKVIPDSDKMREAIERVLKYGDEALEPSQREVLQTIQKELAGVNFAKKTGVVDPEQRTSMTIPAVQTGQVRSTIRFVLERFNNQKAVDTAIEKALLNPDSAIDLLKRPTDNRIRDYTRALRASAIGTGIGLEQVRPPEAEGY